jgi:outer membrane protein TolC
MLLIGLWLLSFSLPSKASLSFNTALVQALKTAPDLKARYADLNAAKHAAIPSASLPDPKISLGLNNMPITGEEQFSTTTDFMTMRQIGVMQEFPNSAKRLARSKAADSLITLSRRQIQIAERRLLQATARSWIELYGVEQQLLLIDELERENQLLTRTHQATHTGRQSMVTDALIPEEENALLAERRDQLIRQQRLTRTQLKRWLGNAAMLPIADQTPEWQLNLNELQMHIKENPEFLIYEAMTQQLDAQVAETRADKRPDWTLEVMYSERGYPADDMVSLKLTMDLPIFSHTRQNPRIAASLAERDALSHEREIKYRNLNAELESDFANYEQLQRAYDRQRDTLLPLANKKIALIQAAWKSNSGVVITDVIHARQAQIEAKLKLIQLATARDSTAAHLYFRYGIRQNDIQLLKQTQSNILINEVAP